MLTTILIILVVIIAAVLIYAATRPNHFVVTRSASIKAPAETIFPLINDFRRWPEWSPFEKLDPQMQRTLSGTDSGKGAAYAWEGNSKAGKGRMEITNSVPSSWSRSSSTSKGRSGPTTRSTSRSRRPATAPRLPGQCAAQGLSLPS